MAKDKFNMEDGPRAEHPEHKKNSLKTPCILVIVFFIVTFICGLLVGHFGIPKGSLRVDGTEGSMTKQDAAGSGAKGKTTPSPKPGLSISQIAKMVHDEVKTENLRESLKYLTEKPHLEGTPGQARLTEYITRTWRDQGLQVKNYWYNILLSYPDTDSPNLVTLVDGNDDVRFSSQLKEKTLNPEIDTSQVIPPFNAYSPSGDVEGTLIYVNYARVEDFMLLKNNFSVNFTGKIVIARYGKIFRGNKVGFAAQYGAAGIILYSDPEDSAPFPSLPVYPDSWWLPPTGVQRGSILLGQGDPTTPWLPSIDTAYRLPDDKLALPKIPCHAISYGDAKPLLSRMIGPEVPEDWRGTIPGITYRIGPGLNETGWKVRLHVSTTNRLVNTSNVIGYIEGSEEPDRYILMGNHRDAWGFGSVDPSSGTMVMMELARIYSDMVKKGWRPRRTLVFCSWGAEEYGLIGSYEWVENFLPILSQRAVTYINVDLSVLGNHSIQVAAFPVMHDVVYQASKNVKTANNVSQSMFDEWRLSQRKKQNEFPVIFPLGSSSDYTAFASFAGIPSIDTAYWFDRIGLDISLYPLYHSVYETYYAYEKYFDPKFEYAQSVTRFVGEMITNLSESPLLPLNLQTYGEYMMDSVIIFEKAQGNFLQSLNISLGPFKQAAEQFKDATRKFEEKRKDISIDDFRTVRLFNDQMMQVERVFISPRGLPGRSTARHVILAPSSKDSYSGTIFPGLTDLVFDIKHADNKEENLEKLKEHLAEVIYTVKVAAANLSPFVDM